jgi:signal transduction histidine kinase
MATVLAAVGLFLYFRLASALDRTIDQGLSARAADVTALVQQADTGLRDARLRGQDTGFAQIIGSNGNIVDSTAGLTGTPLLAGAQIERARTGQTLLVATVNGEAVRLLAQPVNAQGQRLVVVVGTSLRQRTETLDDLRTQLLLGGPIALLLASIAGYVLAAAALRPVEQMGERAATISAASSGRRLPVPPAGDEIARLGERLNDMLARLESALERERALVSNASHELRTPLALLKTEIELALDAPASAPELTAALRSAGAETDRLSQLADDLLLLARVDAGELPLSRTPVAADDLLETIATRFRARGNGTGRTIETTTAAGLVVLADRRRLEQALSNLVENALRHGAGTIVLKALELPDRVELHVSDRGQGFPPAFLERAFERFSRADGFHEGSGLGLAIVAAIAHAHGGTATATNPTGGGADVALTVPLPAKPSGAGVTPAESLDSLRPKTR